VARELINRIPSGRKKARHTAGCVTSEPPKTTDKPYTSYTTKMKVQTDKTHVQTLHNREIMDKGYEVNFNDEGIATVQEDVGKALIENYDSISEVSD